MERDGNRCVECESLQTYVRIKENKRVCRKCGHKENLNKETEVKE